MRKFLVVVDQTPECMNALRFAARRASHTGGGVSMLYVVRPEEFQHWIGVGEIMRREAREEAEKRLEGLAEEVREVAGVIPEFAIREGEPHEEIVAHIAENPEIRLLVLGAASEGEGPGPLVSHFTEKRGGQMPIPLTIVPGALTPEQIDEVC